MVILLKKLLRDLWMYKEQFIAIFFISLVGVLIYTGLEGVWLGMQKNGDVWFESQKLPTAWISIQNSDESILENINSINGIKNVQLSLVKNVNVVVNENEFNLQTIYSTANTIGIPEVLSGSNIDFENKNNSVWLSQGFADTHNLKIGDEITLKYKNIEDKFEIAGTVISPEYINYTGSNLNYQINHEKYGYCYISKLSSKNLFQLDNIYYNQLKIVTDENRNVNEIVLDMNMKAI